MERHKVIAIRHVPFEDLGLLAPLLDEEGWSATYCEAATANLADPCLDAADLLVVLGGPVSVYDQDAYPFLRTELGLLERRLARNRPTLGICLGAQLMANALGSRVYAGEKELGWGPVNLTPAGRTSSLAPLVGQAAVLHWHGDTFDLPNGAVHLAATAACPNQAFAYGSQALALQFHVEADPCQLEQWYVGHAVEIAASGRSVHELRATTARHAEQARQQVGAIFRPWLRGIG